VRIERLRQTYAIEIIFRHFPLHPDTPTAGLTLEQLFAGRGFDLQAAQAKMAALMQREGLPYGQRNMTYNSRLAQELAAWANTQPRGDRIHDALFRAYFVDGLNLAKPAVLIGVAEAVGLSSEAAREVIDLRAFKEAVDGDWQRSRALGVTGVPTFVCDGRGVVGAQPYKALEQLVVEAGATCR